MSKGIARVVHACSWLLVALVLAGSPLAARGPDPIERLSVPGPLHLDGQQYHFAWSSHPTPDFYKQEYLPAGQTLERYRQMLVLDLLTIEATPAQLATAKIGELGARKQTDPLVNHDLVLKQDGSAALLDFVLSARDAQGNLVVEWNAYRYQAMPEGVLLFGISRRAYGDEDARRFLGEELKQNRSRWIDEIAGLAMPAVALQPRARP
ncbi:hypothetical protein FZO89_15030 [Luteimonas viscosa]|uniref:Uncharacterized protein n=1 Tax=Luteimonas viscosa TaxID=1132694 RepID=A0A5D4XH60_9GAMM|nr:hypothetical protein [Luteimonas viscosa]TYT23564.1 hypothetical protein FZO89_15030 [Luteimonas viscosa]